MAIQWKDPEPKDRLLAAVIAASANLNMNEVARVFGQGATYDAVEGQLRKAKKLAKELKTEADGRSGPAKATSRASKTDNVKASPAKSAPVKGARILKPRKAAAPRTKTELLEDNMLLDTTCYGGDDDDETEV
ncbi:hypothetical protein SVAN01_02775 [Stagonosporopsis vannaccii]|nr:hypothetical protein SVAN01_02775 [Stagonosporopsis vannaccii]